MKSLARKNTWAIPLLGGAMISLSLMSALGTEPGGNVGTYQTYCKRPFSAKYSITIPFVSSATKSINFGAGFVYTCGSEASGFQKCVSYSTQCSYKYWGYTKGTVTGITWYYHSWNYLKVFKPFPSFKGYNAPG